MLSGNVTVCLFAWNEEERIERSLRGFDGIFKVLVVDNYSTDGTTDVVARLGHRLIRVRNPGFIETSSVMDRVLASIDTDYILIASVSEIIPFPLLKAYADVANAGSYEVVRAYRESITAGAPIPISGRPSPRFPGELRFFAKGSVSYDNNQVHDRGRVLCAAERVLSLVMNKEMFFYQFRDYDVSYSELKHRQYSDVLAEQKFLAGARFSWARMIYEAFKQFCNSYFRFGSWKFGMLGFIHSFLRWQMEVGIWLRIWEHENSKLRPSVVTENDAFRKRLECEIEQQKHCRVGEA